MLWTPQKGSMNVLSNGGIVGSVSPGTGLTSNVVANLDGAITEVISAAANIQNSWGIYIMCTGIGLATAAAEAKIDIFAGAATEDVLIPDLIVGYSLSGTSQSAYFFPLFIPAGTRISARITSVRASITARVLIWLFGNSPAPFRIGRKVITYGTPVNGSRGRAIVPAASGGAATATQLTVATSEDHFAFIPGFQPETDTTVTPAGYVNIGIGIGAATEQRIGTWWFGKDLNESMTGPWPCFPAFVDVPAGTRLTMLASNCGANDAAYGGHIYAVS